MAMLRRRGGAASTCASAKCRSSLHRGPRLSEKARAERKREEVPIRRETAAKWLGRAEELAKLPKLTGGAFHPYRRLWGTERKHLPDVDVAAAGGWKDTRALRQSYQQADPATVLRVVEIAS